MDSTFPQQAFARLLMRDGAAPQAAATLLSGDSSVAAAG